MKLLSPIANKDVRQAEITKKLLRAQEVDEIVNKNNLRLAKSEMDFNETLARNRLKWASEEEEHAKRIKAMEEELKPLEERKIQALIPIKVYSDGAIKIVEDANKKAEEAESRLSYADDLVEKLEEKLTSVADRENAVAVEEKRQEVARFGIAEQQEDTKYGAERLTLGVAEFNLYKEKEEASLFERKKEVSLAEVNFQAKVDKLKRDTEALRVAQVQVTDQRTTLERALARVKK